jgi:uncharacterized membrane protein
MKRMGVNPNQGQTPDPSGQYGGYSGYTPPPAGDAKEDPYNAQWYGQQQPGAGYQPGDQGAGQQQQQYGAGQQQQYYQPPLSAMNRQQQGNGGANDTSSFGISARLAALLSYLFIWVGGLFFLVSERRNQFVRYAAAQSVVVFGSLFILSIILRLIAVIPLLGTFLLAPLIGFVLTVISFAGGLLWIFLMFQSYRGVTVRLPFASTYADALLARFSRRKGGSSI